jgi:hypothetical protein
MKDERLRATKGAFVNKSFFYNRNIIGMKIFMLAPVFWTPHLYPIPHLPSGREDGNRIPAIRRSTPYPIPHTPFAIRQGRRK